MSEFPDNIKDLAQDQLGAARERKFVLKEQFDEATQLEKAWDDFLQFASRNWYMHILDLLKKQASIFDKMGAKNQDIVPMLNETVRFATVESDSIIRRYPNHLEEACREANLPIDPESRHPRYFFKNGFFRLEIDEKKRVARLTDNEGKLAELPADITAIVETIQLEYKRLFGKSFDGKKFLKRLYKEYVAILKKGKLEFGSSVPIRQITRRMGKNVKGFRTDEFLVNLSNLVEKGPLEVDGFRLDLQQTKDTNQGMLLLGAAGRGYIGFIIFKELQV